MQLFFIKVTLGTVLIPCLTTQWFNMSFIYTTKMLWETFPSWLTILCDCIGAANYFSSSGSRNFFCFYFGVELPWNYVVHMCTLIGHQSHVIKTQLCNSWQQYNFQKTLQPIQVHPSKILIVVLYILHLSCSLHFFSSIIWTCFELSLIPINWYTHTTLLKLFLILKLFHS